MEHLHNKDLQDKTLKTNNSTVFSALLPLFHFAVTSHKKRILHSVNLNEMIPSFHVNCTWFYNTKPELFMSI